MKSIELKDLTVKELKNILKEREVKIPSRAKEADLIKLLEAEMEMDQSEIEEIAEEDAEIAINLISEEEATELREKIEVEVGEIEPEIIREEIETKIGGSKILSFEEKQSLVREACISTKYDFRDPATFKYYVKKLGL